MNYRFLFVAVCLIVSLSPHSFASDLPERPKFPMPLVSVAPKIDGDLTDPAWSNAFEIKGFTRFGSDAPVVEKTTAWVCADGKFLYAAFQCDDEHPERIRASETQRGSNAVWDDDHVTLIVDSQNTRRGSSSFGVNPLGTQTQFLEGGTADNIAWAGDWRAATKRTDKGWTCEIAIPFALLRYPKGAKALGLMVNRQLSRERNPVAWPEIPPAGQSFGTRVQYIPEFAGLTLPTFVPKPTFLPYTLFAAGDGAKGRAGLDIKYPISTTLTGVAALRPDFQTIENDVAGINFSYNEQFVPDRRPFFAEGNEFLPSPDLFYSRRLGALEDAQKVVGKDGNRAVGFLRTHSSGPDGRTSLALNLREGIGALSGYGVSAVSDGGPGLSESRALRVFADWGRTMGDRQNSLSVARTGTWLSGQQKGGDSRIEVRSRAPQGKARYRLSYNTLDDDFNSPLGLIGDRDRRGFAGNVGWGSQLDKGPLAAYDIALDVRHFDRQTGGFFFEDVGFDVYGENRRGWGAGLNLDEGRRKNDPLLPEVFHDRTVGGNLGWNKRTLFQQGGVGFRAGRQAGQPLQTMGVGQGFLVSRPFSMNARYNQQKLGDVLTRQTVLTGTLRLSTLQAISGRLVSQNGTGNSQNVGPQEGTNLYFAYSQRSRLGTDYFLLVGDPNSPDTRGTITLKALRAF